MKIEKIGLLLLLISMIGCKADLEGNKKTDESSYSKKQETEVLKLDPVDQKKNVEKTKNESKDSSLVIKNSDSLKLVKGLVDIKEIDPSIRVDLKYATSDNFMHKVLYSNLKRALLQKDVALRLAKVQEKLKSIHPNYSLLVYDAARPVSVQQKMWNALDTIPVKERSKFVSNPANRSIHNFGAAIDLTIVDGNGKPLDMGAGYDDIRKIAYPSLESKFLASGELTQKQIDNRKLLRSVMSSEGFRNIPTEWWHFNACSRDEAKRIYKVLMEEPNY
jgi:D-alanyl-D-alanine dipeptidase